MGLDAFDAAYLTPLEFREVIKRVFALNLSPKGEHKHNLSHTFSNVFFPFQQTLSTHRINSHYQHSLLSFLSIPL